MLLTKDLKILWGHTLSANTDFVPYFTPPLPPGTPNSNNLTKYLPFQMSKKVIKFCWILDYQLQITGRDVNKLRFERYGETALHIATEKDFLEAAKWLINKRADLEAKDTFGRTPLHYAALKDSVDVACLLISHGAKVDAKTDIGWTPLHHAAYFIAPKVAQLLINNGADKNTKISGNIKDNGKKPIDYAREQGHSEMVALLQ